jgi:hypothetical protein
MTEPATPAPLRTVRILALISASLALITLLLAVAWVREHDRAERFQAVSDCLRGVAEEDRVPQDHECPREAGLRATH